MYIFKVGDLITGRPEAPYFITSEEGTYKVEKLQGTEDMIVRVITHRNEDNIGDKFPVRKVFFRLAERKGNFRR